MQLQRDFHRKNVLVIYNFKILKNQKKIIKMIYINNKKK